LVLASEFVAILRGDIEITVMKHHLVILIVLISSVVSAQEFTSRYDPENEFSKFSLGLGAGLDFGGFGARITVSPAKSVGLFAGLGYNLVGFGFNGGARFRLIPDKRVNPTFLAMYGYNGVIKVIDKEQYDDSYNGVSIGAGIQLNSKNKPNYWSFELLLPFRSQEFHDDLDRVKMDPYVEISDPLPVAISVGYHFALD